MRAAVEPMTSSRNMRTILSLFAGVTLAFSALQAQTSTPVVVQAATGPAAVPAQAAAQAPAANTAAAQSTLKFLQDMKAANAETLKKQEAVLLQLEELQKTADQIRIYTKRG